MQGEAQDLREDFQAKILTNETVQKTVNGLVI